MNRFFVALVLTLTSSFLNSQIRYTDQLKSTSIFTEAPEELKYNKPFMRQWWFYEQRAYPENYIPDEAYSNALSQKEFLRANKENSAIPDFSWVSLGPTPGAYFGYGNISGRVVSGANDPNNPNFIYIGPANGGVWKTTNSGIRWNPLTDNEPSLSIVLSQ